MVVDIDPDGRICSVGQVNGTLHVYNTGRHASAPSSVYNLTIVGANAWMNVNIAAGATDSYAANGGAVYIQNIGPSALQLLYLKPGERGSPQDAGWTEVDAFPDP